ncbi:MAG: class I SAM-dependent methyltransferase [Trueperaceae bacterium]
MPDWDDPDTVAFFRDRPPDHRLVALVESGALPCGARVLDLGCAGGRNADYLTTLDIDVLAVDGSAAMVAATRARLARTLGDTEAERRVRQDRVDALADLPDAAFDLVLALGVLQYAGSEAAFDVAVATVGRVLRADGAVLVAHFAPSSRPGGRELAPVVGAAHTFVGWGGRDEATPMVLHEPDGLDAAFAAHGLKPAEPTVRVERRTGPDDRGAASDPHPAWGMRVTVNARYRRAAD